MRRIIVQYGLPEDPAAFDAYYKNTHIPLAAAMPDLVSFEVSKGPVNCSDEDHPIYLAAVLSYASAESMEVSFASAEGQAAVADVANFATGGATLVTIDTEELL